MRKKNTSPTRVAIYARVSSERQAEKELSIPAQLKALKKYALSRRWDAVAECVDEAESARSANRPAFKDMIAAAKNRVKPFDCILVWKLSRFARNREDSVIYKSPLKRRKISVVSMNEHVDESPAGSLLEGIIEVIDEFYSANLSQDTIRGMKENAARGFRNGGMTPFGYKRSSTSHGSATKSKLTPDEREAPIVRRVFDLAVQGHGAREIARSLNAEGLRTRTGKHFAATGINHMLRNEAYVGTIVWNRYGKGSGTRQRKDDSEVIRVPDCHTLLVDKDVFEEVQGLLTSRRPSVKHPMTVSSRYLLSGLTHCAQCGSTAIGANGKSGRYLYYRCNSRLTKGATVCDAPAINAKKLEAFVVDRIKENILTEENLRGLVDLTNEEMRLHKRRAVKQLDGLDREGRSVEQRLARLYAALESGKVDIDDLAPRLRELRARQRELDEKRDEALDEMSQAGDRLFDPLTMDHYMGDLRRILQSASFLECKNFLGTFIRRIDFNRQHVGIEYTVPVPAGDGLTNTAEVLSVRGVGSPVWPPGRTFAWVWFKLPQTVSRRKPPASRRPKRRNPVAQALEWQQRLESGKVSSRAELARQLGVTRAHVTNVLSLVHLAPQVRALILSLGDPIKGKGFGIHTLRSLLHRSMDEQINWIKETQNRRT